LFFRSEDAIDTWCAEHGMARGETLPVEQVWSLAQLWYHNRLDADYHGRSAAEAVAIFRRLGLTSPFWSLEDGA